MVEWRVEQHPRGAFEVFVAPPFEAVGAFLTLEAKSSNVVAHLMRYLGEVVQGKREGFGIAFNLFALEADPAKVAVAEDEDLAPGVPRSCEMPTVDFRHLLEEWSEFLKARGR
jgi:hypothetical protein